MEMHPFHMGGEGLIKRRPIGKPHGDRQPQPRQFILGQGMGLPVLKCLEPVLGVAKAPIRIA